jgi:hypothetical protein
MTTNGCDNVVIAAVIMKRYETHHSTPTVIVNNTTDCHM